MFRAYLVLSISTIAVAPSWGAVVVYEANMSFPEAEGWEYTPFCEPVRTLSDGWLVQHVFPNCGGPPGGDRDRYVRSLADFAGEQEFYFEWRLKTDGNRSEIPGVAPASFTTANLFGISYHFTIATDQVRLIRDNFLPIVYVNLRPDVPHTFRLELYGSKQYIWYIDGTAVDDGRPEGAYPTSDAVLSWAASAWYLESTTRWDYVLYGVIPQDARGDFDTSASIDLFDFYYFHECLTNERIGINGGPGNDAGPGCRWADFDSDQDVDLSDAASFQNAFGDQ